VENYCGDHSGTCVRLEKLEDNVSKLWRKWDSIHTLLVGTLVSTVLSLIGVIVMLIKR
jgi:hypothetical protein